MDSRINFIFVCFFMDFNVSIVNAKFKTNPLESVNYNDSVIKKFQSRSTFSAKDILYLHHAFVFEILKWEEGLISFQLDKNFDEYEIDNILAAMYAIERSSCIRFAAHDPSLGPDYHYVMIKKVYDNRFEDISDVGCMYWGKQFLQLSVDMVKEHTTILREMLHTIGFNHHHQRSDRDNFIEIHLENTNLSESHIIENYAKMIKFDPLVKYLTPFDFNSVMLYDENEFSIDNKSVVTSKVKGRRMSTSRHRSLSIYDKILLNQFYSCHTVDKVKSKIFFENEDEMAYPMVINYHEIQRAKKHVEENEAYKNWFEDKDKCWAGTDKQTYGYTGYRIRTRCCILI